MPSRQQQRAGQKKGLDKLAIQIPAGRMTAIMGPSGAGKTTVCKEAIGLNESFVPSTIEKPTTAAERAETAVAWRLGMQAFPLSALEKQMGYVAQEEHFLDNLSVLGHLRAARQTRLSDVFVDAEPAIPSLDTILDRLGLAHKANSSVNELSGGEKKRVSIAIELAALPRVGVLLADEPTSGLDPCTSLALLRFL